MPPTCQMGRQMARLIQQIQKINKSAGYPNPFGSESLKVSRSADEQGLCLHAKTNSNLPTLFDSNYLSTVSSTRVCYCTLRTTVNVSCTSYGKRLPRVDASRLFHHIHTCTWPLRCRRTKTGNHYKPSITMILSTALPPKKKMSSNSKQATSRSTFARRSIKSVFSGDVI